MKKIPLTPYHSHVILTRTVREAKRVYRRLYKSELELPHNARGYTVTLERKGCADSYFVYAGSVSDLAHEFGHVLLWLFKAIGSDPAEGGGEPFCYMMSYLMEEARG
ncbi:MAG: hypothetical protein Q8R92_05990 [Deltaproteobacteria bacterium]|nr:hypothetical protein [Deltaproteobacteria bacterium]